MIDLKPELYITKTARKYDGILPDHCFTTEFINWHNNYGEGLNIPPGITIMEGIFEYELVDCYFDWLREAWILDYKLKEWE